MIDIYWESYVFESHGPIGRLCSILRGWHYYQITVLPGHIIPNSIFYCILCLTVPLWAWGRHAVYTLSRQASQPFSAQSGVQIWCNPFLRINESLTPHFRRWVHSVLYLYRNHRSEMFYISCCIQTLVYFLLAYIILF